MEDQPTHDEMQAVAAFKNVGFVQIQVKLVLPISTPVN